MKWILKKLIKTTSLGAIPVKKSLDKNVYEYNHIKWEYRKEKNLIRNEQIIEEFEKDLIKNDKIKFEKKLKLYEELLKYAKKIGKFPSKNLLEGIEYDIKYARIINGFKKSN